MDRHRRAVRGRRRQGVGVMPAGQHWEEAANGDKHIPGESLL